jgi:hypothetical protein
MIGLVESPIIEAAAFSCATNFPAEPNIPDPTNHQKPQPPSNFPNLLAANQETALSATLAGVISGKKS